jgi:hypothetical protein
MRVDIFEKFSWRPAKGAFPVVLVITSTIILRNGLFSLAQKTGKVASTISKGEIQMGAVVSVSVDISQPGIVPRRTVVVGETFVVTIWIEDDGAGITPVVFDRIVLGVYFNDKTSGVLGVTRTHFPNAGELASLSGTVDAFSKRPVVPHMEMTLMPDEKVMPEHFLSSAGVAGYENTKTPFTLFPGKPVLFAAGKINAGFRSLSVGTSTIMACAPHGHAELSFKGKPMYAKTIPAVVTVTEERTHPPIQEFEAVARSA